MSPQESTVQGDEKECEQAEEQGMDYRIAGEGPLTLLTSPTLGVFASPVSHSRLPSEKAA